MASISSGRKQAEKFTPEEYLDHHGVTTYFKDAVTLVLENRPEDPIDFIADYFKNVIEGTSPVVRSYRYIRLTPRTKSAFFDNLVAAYQSLCRSKSGGVDGDDSGGKGQERKIVTYGEMEDLVKLICADFPPETLHVVHRMMGQPADSSITFSEFASAINAVLLHEEFLHEVERLFQLLSEEKEMTGKVRRDELMALFAQHVNNMPETAASAQCIRKCLVILASADEEISFQYFFRSFTTLLDSGSANWR